MLKDVRKSKFLAFERDGQSWCNIRLEVDDFMYLER